MDKYDVPLDLKSENSLSLILKRLKKNSLVLEFGCANGCLTKYLHEDMSCTVDIVEYDAHSGQTAAKYARNVCLGEQDGDIEKYRWAEKLTGIKYDYIVFADVLEHLINPQAALKQCKDFLKEYGSILISIPNIAHNSIILNLLKDEFQYTRCGLLDDTHLRFFTYKSFKRLLQESGFCTVYEDATWSSVGQNEINITYDDFYDSNIDIIKERKLGYAYQYIFEVCMGDFPHKCDNRLKFLLSLENEIKRNVGYNEYEALYNEIIHSDSWRLTEPCRVAAAYLKNFMNHNQASRLLLKGVISLKNDGIRETFYKTKHKLENIHNDSDFERECQDEYECPNGYYSIYQEEEFYSGKPDVKVLALYLPQFYCFPENDKWWGKGFNEWTNTRKAEPLFDGHYQPRTPHDAVGYYDLTNLEVLKQQAEMAKRHGIYGFCIYYYWFSGKCLMEKPLDLLLAHPEIDIPFCLCWANENWTRRWDGLEQDILIAQKYTKEDPILFIQDMKKYIQDKRYIRVKGKPVIIVYKPSIIPDVKKVFKIWKETAKEIGIGEISIWICSTRGETCESLGLGDFVDKEVEFPPHDIPVEGNEELIPGTYGHIYNYSKIVDDILKKRKRKPKNTRLYRTVMMGWDNSARRKKDYSIFNKYDLKKYYDWLTANIKEAGSVYAPEERFVFINAWNEWGEGTYLEPDLKYGYANLNTTAKAILGQPFSVKKTLQREGYAASRIAVQVHIFYVDLADEVIAHLNHIPAEFDCFITTDSMSKAQILFSLFRAKCNTQQLEILVVDNQGRDVAPLLLQMHAQLSEYEYLCHIHTKKTKHACNGDEWRRYLFEELLGNKESIEEILSFFALDKKIGIIYPETFQGVREWGSWGGNKETTQKLIDKMGLAMDLNEELQFPAGNMFWCRTDAVRQIFDYAFKIDDFPLESGQVDQTIMHSIERLWCYLVRYNGYKVKELLPRKQTP